MGRAGVGRQPLLPYSAWYLLENVLLLRLHAYNPVEVEVMFQLAVVDVLCDMVWCGVVLCG
jgi:hypothetical protein